MYLVIGTSLLLGLTVVAIAAYAAKTISEVLENDMDLFSELDEESEF